MGEQNENETHSRALITGGAGFVGSHLAESLLRSGYHVTALDNLSTGRMQNIEHLLADDRFSFVDDNVTRGEIVDPLVRECDVVFHLAAAVGVKLILADPIGSFETNVRGTEAVLKSAARHGKKVLIASTSEVYGKVSHIPQREDDDVVIGATRFSRWSYATCKMLDEFLGLSYYRESAVPVIVFRLFNTVGPRQTGMYGMVVPRFVESAIRREPLHVYGDGRQSRCFLHVHDAVEAIIRLAHTPGAVGQVFNIGGTESVTILELAERVLAHVGLVPRGSRGTRLLGAHGRLWNGAARKGLIVFVPYEEAYPGGGYEDIRRRVPAVTKMRTFTGWTPTRSLDDILADLVRAYRPVAQAASEPLNAVTTPDLESAAVM